MACLRYAHFATTFALKGQRAGANRFARCMRHSYRRLVVIAPSLLDANPAHDHVWQQRQHDNTLHHRSSKGQFLHLGAHGLVVTVSSWVAAMSRRGIAERSTDGVHCHHRRSYLPEPQLGRVLLRQADLAELSSEPNRAQPASQCHYFEPCRH
jgi:hypothetical protein